MAKKHLGQNFLKSKAAINKMVAAANLSENDRVVEVGPGKGAITGELLNSSAKVVGIEKDEELIPLLQEKFEQEISEKRFEIIQEDVLEFETKDLEDYKVVANIPYYITGAIIRHFLESQNPPKEMVLLMQKEVAERIQAKDGKESILSLSVKAYGTPKIVGNVNRRYFSPSPKVDSSILQVKEITKDFFDSFSEEDFFLVVKTSFAHKRKTLLNNLSVKFDKEKSKKALEKLGLDENIRAEDLDLSTYSGLTKILI